MRLDPTTLDELATFYARRLPAASGEVAAAAGLRAPTGSGREAWRALLTEAEGADRLGAVARAVSDMLPGDENAREAARSLGGRRPATWAVAAVASALALVGVLGIGGLSLVAFVGPAQADVATAPPTPEEKPVTAQAAASEAAGTPAGDASTDAAAPVVPGASTDRSLTRAPATARLTPAAGSGDLPSACHGTGTIGWWYAGTTAPGKTGDTIAMPRGATVRSAPPSSEHNWRMEPPVRCGLKAGDTVRLGEVRAMPGGFYWVELPG